MQKKYLEENWRNFMKNNSEICEKIMNSYLLLDKNEVIPPKISLHLLTCQKCRTEVHYLSLAEKIAAKPLKTKLLPEKQIKRKPISMTKWVLCGSIMMIFLMIFGITSKNADSELQVTFYIFFALAICVYCAVFIASNLDYFIKKIDTLHIASLKI